MRVPEAASMTAAGRRQEIVSLLAAALCRLPITPQIPSEPADMPCFAAASAAQCDSPAQPPENGGQA